eukprot:Rmarinus@m.5416
MSDFDREFIEERHRLDAQWRARSSKREEAEIAVFSKDAPRLLKRGEDYESAHTGVPMRNRKPLLSSHQSRKENSKTIVSNSKTANTSIGVEERSDATQNHTEVINTHTEPSNNRRKEKTSSKGRDSGHPVVNTIKKAVSGMRSTLDGDSEGWDEALEAVHSVRKSDLVKFVSLIEKKYLTALREKRSCAPSAPLPFEELRLVLKGARNTYALLLAQYPELSTQKNFGQRVWMLHYKWIEDAISGIRTCEDENDLQIFKDAFKILLDDFSAFFTTLGAFLWRIYNLENALSNGRSASESTYIDQEPVIDVVSNAVVKFNQVGDTSGSDVDDVDNGAINCGKSSRVAASLDICGGVMVVLGDLARYRVTHISEEKNWVDAEAYYCQALQLVPGVGRVHNQLALISMYEGNYVDSLFHFLRSLGTFSHKPFLAKENMYSLLERVRLMVADTTSLSTKDISERFELHFVRAHGILITRISMETFDVVCELAFNELQLILPELAEGTLLRVFVINVLQMYHQESSSILRGGGYETTVRWDLLFGVFQRVVDEFTKRTSPSTHLGQHTSPSVNHDKHTSSSTEPGSRHVLGPSPTTNVTLFGPLHFMVRWFHDVWCDIPEECVDSQLLFRIATLCNHVIALRPPSVIGHESVWTPPATSPLEVSELRGCLLLDQLPLDCACEGTVECFHHRVSGFRQLADFLVSKNLLTASADGTYAIASPKPSVLNASGFVDEELLEAASWFSYGVTQYSRGDFQVAMSAFLRSMELRWTEAAQLMRNRCVSNTIRIHRSKETRLREPLSAPETTSGEPVPYSARALTPTDVDLNVDLEEDIPEFPVSFENVEGVPVKSVRGLLSVNESTMKEIESSEKPGSTTSRRARSSVSSRGPHTRGERNIAHRRPRADDYYIDENPEYKPLIVLDSPNVAMRHGSTTKRRKFSCRGIELAAKYYTARGHKVVGFLPEYYLDYEDIGRRQAAQRVGFDQNASRLPDDIALLRRLVDEGVLCATPSKDYDDSYSIAHANRSDACIVTNDRYSDYIEKHPASRRWIRTHCISFTFCGDDFLPNPDFVFPAPREEKKGHEESTDENTVGEYGHGTAVGGCGGCDGVENDNDNDIGHSNYNGTNDYDGDGGDKAGDDNDNDNGAGDYDVDGGGDDDDDNDDGDDDNDNDNDNDDGDGDNDNDDPCVCAPSDDGLPQPTSDEITAGGKPFESHDEETDEVFLY